MEGTELGACDKVKRAGGRRLKGIAMGKGSAATNWENTKGVEGNPKALRMRDEQDEILCEFERSSVSQSMPVACVAE